MNVSTVTMLVILGIVISIAIYNYLQFKETANELDRIINFKSNMKEYEDEYKASIMAQRKELAELSLARRTAQEKYEREMAELNKHKLETNELEMKKKQVSERVHKELEVELAEIRASFEEDKNKIESALSDLKSKQRQTTENLKKVAESEDEKAFRMITLSKASLHDMKELQKVEKTLNNQEILRKLIYKTYVETPMNEMFDRLDIKTEPGVYMIKNELDGKTYVGQSVNVRSRLREHVKSAIGTSNIAHQAVHEAMEDEGIENFTFFLLDSIDRESLNEREKYWIDFYESNNWGYNRTRGGS